MIFNLIGSIIALLAWFVGTFVMPVGLGLIHLLLVAGVLLWIRWWALLPPRAPHS